MPIWGQANGLHCDGLWRLQSEPEPHPECHKSIKAPYHNQCPTPCVGPEALPPGRIALQALSSSATLSKPPPVLGRRAGSPVSGVTCLIRLSCNS